MKETARWRSRVRGCVLGAALGDAIGGPFEFGPLERAVALTGRSPAGADGPWIDGLYPYPAPTGPHGVWPDPRSVDGRPPAGTGTDDTRYNWLFLELTADLGHMPSAQELAQRFIQVYERPESFFPAHVELARRQFAYWEGACRGCLGQTSAQYPGLTPDLLLARGLGFNYPVLSGLIALPSAGLLYPGKPEEAYRETFRTAFFEVGYAREAVALFAAAISMVIVEAMEPQAVYERIMGYDPLHLGNEFGPPFVVGHLSSVLEVIAEVRSDREAAHALSVALRAYHPFDPFRALAVALLACVAARSDPLAQVFLRSAIQIAANHVRIDEQGRATRYEDIDCYAGIAGAMAGAMAGEEAIPASMLEQVVEANRAVYGMDLEATIDRFVECCIDPFEGLDC